MQTNNVEIRVLIKGKTITEYFHNGANFVEGREGSNFELELINRNPFRVEAVVSVDGLSVTDGKEAGVHSSGYLVEANSTVRIPGWKLDDETVAKFVFSGKGQSYATAMTGDSRNNGVLGAMVFAERHRRPVYKPTKAREPLARPVHPYYGDPRGIMRSKGIAPNGGFSYTADTYNVSAQTLASGAIASATLASTQAAYATTQNADVLDGQHGSYFTSSVSGSRRIQAKALENTATLNNLGTGFGKAAEFQTQVVQFERGDMIAMLVLYYDNARGLKARGIQVGRPSRVRHTAQTPQAFPGMNCAPPPGWEG